MRIVSLVPSLTETICEIGLADFLVGCTNFCTEPVESLKSVAKVGGTKDPNIDLINELQPTHILFSKEENNLDHYLKLSHHNTFVSDVHQVENVPEMLREMAVFLDHTGCDLLAEKIKGKLSFPPRSADVAYFIWREPWMVASASTYISSALAVHGFQITKKSSSAIDGSDAHRYPLFDHSDLESVQLCLFSSEPYSFRKRHIKEFISQFSPKGKKTYLCDGKIFSWYGYSTLLLLERDFNGLFTQVERF